MNVMLCYVMLCDVTHFRSHLGADSQSNTCMNVVSLIVPFISTLAPYSRSSFTTSTCLREAECTRAVHPS